MIQGTRDIVKIHKKAKQAEDLLKDCVIALQSFKCSTNGRNIIIRIALQQRNS